MEIEEAIAIPKTPIAGTPNHPKTKITSRTIFKGLEIKTAGRITFGCLIPIKKALRDKNII
jgi:hypothetical protein